LLIFRLAGSSMFPSLSVGSLPGAAALDAADGVLDGKFFGSQIGVASQVAPLVASPPISGWGTVAPGYVSGYATPTATSVVRSDFGFSLCSFESFS